MSTVCMELEDALTIFSYSSPYPVQLSLLPSTTATLPAPRTPRGRRSWSLDQLDCRRRQRRHSEVPVRARPARHSLSDGRRLGSEMVHKDLYLPTERHRRQLDATGQSTHLSSQQRPAQSVDDDNSTASRSADVCDTQNSVHEPGHIRVATATDNKTTGVAQQLATTTVTASSTTVHVADKMLTTSPLGVADSKFNTDVVVHLDDERDQSDDELGSRPETQQHRSTCLNKTSDGFSDNDVMSYHHQHQQQQRQMEAEQTSLQEASYRHNGVDSSVQRTADEHAAESPIELATTTDELFYDINLDDDDTANIRRQRPASKTKRSLIGSLKSLLKSSSAESNRKKRKSSLTVGGAMAYVPSDEDRAHESTSVRYVVREQNPDNSDSVGHECTSEINTSVQQTSTDISSEFVGSKSNELSSFINEVLAAASNTEAHEIHHKQPYTGQSDVEEIKLVTHDVRNSPSTRFEELNSTKLPGTTVADDSLTEGDVDQSRVADGKALVASDDVTEVHHRMTTTSREELQVIKALHQTGTLNDASTALNQLRAVRSSELEAQHGNIHPSQRLSHVDEDIITSSKTSSVMHSNGKVQEERTRTHLDFINTETNDASRITVKENGVDMMDESCGLLAAEADFITAALRSGFQRDSFVVQEQEMVDARHQGDKRNSLSIVAGVSDEVHRVSASDVESPWQPARPLSQHLDVSYDYLRHPVVIQVNEPTVTVAVSDMNETVSATTASRPQVVKDKRSSASDLDLSDVTTDIPSVLTMMLNLFGVRDGAKRAEISTDDHVPSRHCVVDMETSTSTSSGKSPAQVNDDVMGSGRSTVETDREDAHAVDDKFQNEAEHEATGSMLDRHVDWLNKQSPAENHDPSASNHSHGLDYFHVTPSDSQVFTHQSTEYSFTPNSDKYLNVNASRMRLNKETEKTSHSTSLSHHEQDKPQYVHRSDASVVPIVSKSHDKDPSLVMGENHSRSSGFVDGDRISQTVEKLYGSQTTIPNYDLAMMGNIEESRNRIANNQTVQQPHVVRVPTISRNRLLINSPEGTSPTREHVKRSNSDVRPSSGDFTFPTREHVKRSNSAVRPSPGNFTFVVQRQVKVDSNYERSLSTGSSNNTGSSNVSEKPAYTFVMPAVRRCSASDYNNNDQLFRSSIPQTASDGRKSEIKTPTVTTPRYSEIYSSKYNSSQVVDVTVHHSVTRGRRPVRTGSGNVFDQKQINPVWNSAHQPTVNSRLSGSMKELGMSGTTSPSINTCDPLSQTSTSGMRELAVSGTTTSPSINTCDPPSQTSTSGMKELACNTSPSMPTSSPPSQTCTANPTVDSLNNKTLLCPVSDHITGSVPDLQSTSLGLDDFCRSESRLDVIASSSHGCHVTNDDDDATSHDVTRLRLEPLDVRSIVMETGSGRSSAEESEGQRVSRLTVLLGSGSGNQQQLNNRRRPRRRRIVCLSHSSLELSTSNDVTSPTH